MGQIQQKTMCFVLLWAFCFVVFVDCSCQANVSLYEEPRQEKSKEREPAPGPNQESDGALVFPEYEQDESFVWDASDDRVKERGELFAREDSLLDCVPPKRNCGGICVHTRFDLNHCGECGRRCKRIWNGYCWRGHCQNGVCDSGCTGCPCNGTCVDLHKDINHCGTCGNACTDGRVCISASCRCPTGERFSTRKLTGPWV